MNEGVLEWTRLRNLQRGDLLVSLKGATDPQGQKPNPASADLAKPAIATTENTQTLPDEGRGTTANGKVRFVLNQIAKSLCTVMGYATTITRKSIGRTGTAAEQKKPSAPLESNLDMASHLTNTQQSSKNKGANALYVENCPETMSGPIGAANCALTIATTLEKFGVSSATTAISPLAMVRHQQYLNELQRISDFTADPIVSITPDGEEEVFDVEIDRTENFIANGVVSHNTRWSLRDLTGQVLEASAARGGDKWEVIEFPAILPSGNPLWPEFWSFDELDAIRKELPNGKWMAQYQQQPTSDSSAIIKREWWQEWTKDKPPAVEFIIMAMDTAFEKKTSADYSAAVLFGVWENPEDNYEPNLILLEAWRDRLEFPELKQKTMELYKEWEPDSVIIEKKASGAPLIYELRRMGIPAQEFTPSKGNDKITRLNAIADIFASGKVWAPKRRWSEEVIDEVASFPAGKNDDLVDCVSLALARFRSGGFVGTKRDEEDEDYGLYKMRKAAYY
jgi:predicted phage terminase large subunit-like protein